MGPLRVPHLSLSWCTQIPITGPAAFYRQEILSAHAQKSTEALKSCALQLAHICVAPTETEVGNQEQVKRSMDLKKELWWFLLSYYGTLVVKKHWAREWIIWQVRLTTICLKGILFFPPRWSGDLEFSREATQTSP